MGWRALVLFLWAGCAPSGPLTVSVTEYDPIAESSSALEDGATLHLQIPPQGGVVLFVGAIADAGGVLELDARLSSGGQVVGEDRRQVRFTPQPDGRYAPANGSISQVANLPVCPAGGIVAEDAPATLELTVRDGDRSGTTTLQVVPRCLQTDASVLSLCHCECAADYNGHC